MIHPHTTLAEITPSIGHGVVATRFIPRGTLVYVKDALEIEVRPTDALLHDPLHGPIIERYSYTDQRGVRILSWDLAKFVNHCCTPNTVSTGYGFEIAICDIEPGEQITDDYGVLNIEHNLECLCGSPQCRGLIRHDDILHLAPHYDPIIREALSEAKEIEQPLIEFVDPMTRTRLNSYLNTGKGYRSLRRLWHRRGQGAPVEQPARAVAVSAA